MFVVFLFFPLFKFAWVRAGWRSSWVRGVTDQSVLKGHSKVSRNWGTAEMTFRCVLELCVFIPALTLAATVRILVRGRDCYTLSAFQAAGGAEASESSDGRMKHD